jgi:hypothetical protein
MYTILGILIFKGESASWMVWSLSLAREDIGENIALLCFDYVLLDKF